MARFTLRCQTSLAYAVLPAVLLAVAPLQGKPQEEKDPVTMTATTDRPDAVYSCGEEATFAITVTNAGKPAQGSVSIQFTFDGGKTLDRKELTLTDGKAQATTTLQQPGFLLCSASYVLDGKRRNALAGAGFEPKRIEASTVMPEDFAAFWDEGRQRLAAMPLDLRMRKLEKHSDDSQDSYAISFQNVNDSRIYGFLCVPKQQKPPYPAWVTVPGAGPGPFGPSGKGYAARGVLALTVGVHTYDVGTLTKEEINAAYKELNSTGTYSHHGAPDRETYYFRRAVLGIDRAISWLASRDDFDGRHMVIDGSSQGGAMALTLAGFNPHITAAAANVPAMCDHTAYLQERSPGWPKIVTSAPEDQREARAGMAPYFDAVNFARQITCPVIVSAGFIDRTCPPGSVYAAFNEIDAPKRIFDGPLAGHQWNVGDYRSFAGKWVEGQLGIAPVLPPTAEKTP
jgi:cephalosporin-C deacetylase-like acetyl esterase